MADSDESAAPSAAGGRRKYFIFGAVLLASLLADQLTKIWARHSLRPIHEITVIDGFFDLRYSENPGSAFGLFRGIPGARWLLLAIGIGAMFVIARLVWKARPDQTKLAVFLGLLAGGALGNIIDRVIISRVTDFVVWKFHEHEWPTFNIADAALVIGVLALFLFGGEKKSAAPATNGGRARKRT